mmetsp:Transcript_144278/g.462098  ORF Transcript_144278/g.462098 Transcript_144278/m.462098 type:complete len:220 (-) Transcript_144278:850-1509(-)
MLPTRHFRRLANVRSMPPSHPRSHSTASEKERKAHGHPCHKSSFSKALASPASGVARRQTSARVTRRLPGGQKSASSKAACASPALAAVSAAAEGPAQAAVPAAAVRRAASSAQQTRASAKSSSPRISSGCRRWRWCMAQSKAVCPFASTKHALARHPSSRSATQPRPNRQATCTAVCRSRFGALILVPPANISAAACTKPGPLSVRSAKCNRPPQACA